MACHQTTCFLRFANTKKDNEKPAFPVIAAVAPTHGRAWEQTQEQRQRDGWRDQRDKGCRRFHPLRGSKGKHARSQQGADQRAEHQSRRVSPRRLGKHRRRAQGFGLCRTT